MDELVRPVDVVSNEKNVQLREQFDNVFGRVREHYLHPVWSPDNG